MSFWGIEVKPGEPYIFDTFFLFGKLVLTQATLGAGSAGEKSILQVNIGDRCPIYLCTLLPDKSECCSLNLEFLEKDAVTFSVVGPSSIHLSGFIQGNNDVDYDSDLSGEYISDSDSESRKCDSEGDFEDGFIDDDVDAFFPPSPVRNSGVVIEEIVDDKKATENTQTKKEKKNQLAHSKNNKNAGKQIGVMENTDALVLESEDEDGFPVSSSLKSENTKSNTTRTAVEGKKKKKKDEAKDYVVSEKSLKRKVDAIKPSNEKKSDVVEVANGDESENKKKKQKKKKKAKTEKEEEVSNVKQDASIEDKQTSKIEKEAKRSKPKPAQVRTYPNGLVIEEVAMGKPDGKRASRGSKVSVHYIGKLKKNGKVFDSNIGRKPFKFRLGIGQVIKGWDVGVEGMRIGDKRRLTLPPAMGYGASGAPPDIPPNAWLVFDVELVDVAR